MESRFSADDLARLEDIIASVRAESGTMHALGADGALHLRAAIGIPEPVLAIVAVVPMGKGMAGLAAERRAPVNSCNIQQDASGDVRPGARATGLAGSVCVPILDEGGALLGTLGVATRAERTFTEGEERALMQRGRSFFSPRAS